MSYRLAIKRIGEHNMWKAKIDALQRLSLSATNLDHLQVRRDVAFLLTTKNARNMRWDGRIQTNPLGLPFWAAGG